MAAKKTSHTPSKSGFIRQQPASMSAADVVSAAKAAGIQLTSTLVYTVRGRTKVTKTAAKRAATKSSAAKTASKAATPKSASTSSKAEFVRLRGDLSPKEIVEDALANGIKFDADYVYTVRGYDRRASQKKRAAKKAAKPVSTIAESPAGTSKPASNGTRPSSGTSVEDVLRAVAAELGLGRAIEILQGERARVRAVIGG